MPNPTRSDEGVDRYPFRCSKTDLGKNPQILSTTQVITEGHHDDRWYGSSQPPEVPHWQRGVRIENPTSKRVVSWTIHFLLLLFPFAYVGLGIAVAILDGKSVTQMTIGGVIQIQGDNVVNIIKRGIKWAVTLWPIGFGVVFCRVLKTFATYKAEHGTELMTLEQLLASRSFGSAAMAPLSFKKINLTMIALLGLWALSPLMTQALQNIFSFSLICFQEDTPQLKYINTKYLPYILQDATGGGQSDPESLFKSLIISTPETIMQSPVDIWGNPKIPSLEILSNLPQVNGWYDLSAKIADGIEQPILFSQNSSENSSKSEYELLYSSLTGVKVAGLPRNASTYGVKSQFTVETGYYTLSCSPFVDTTLRNLYDNRDTKFNGTYDYDKYSCGADISCTLPQIGTLYMQPHFNEDFILESFVFANMRGADDGWNTQFQYTTCNVKVQSVDTEIVCIDRACEAVRMRKSPEKVPFMSVPAKTLEYGVGSTSFVPQFISAFVRSTVTIEMTNSAKDGVLAGHATQLQNWLREPTNALRNQGSWLDYSEIPIATFSQRLAILLNTFVQGDYSPEDLIKGPTETLTLVGDSEQHGIVSTVTAQSRRYHTVYQCNWVWLGVLLATCAIVLAIIFAGAYLESKMLGPDILGYVSSNTRHNPYVPLPPGGSMLDGMERTRLLGHIRVRMQDVNPDQSVGFVELSSLPGEPLRQGRMYW